MSEQDGTLPPEVRKGYLHGAIGRMAELHGTYYGRTWHFGLAFEAKVATELSHFLMRYDEARDSFWTLVSEDRVEGGLAVDAEHAASSGAHLRWFIVSERMRGHGYGDMLLRMALRFCRSKGYPKVTLWTFAGLQPARRLYERHGFRLAEERVGSTWGKEVQEQRFELLIGR
jgi:GNAT superfamily N-acetyltransferase